MTTVDIITNFWLAVILATFCIRFFDCFTDESKHIDILEYLTNFDADDKRKTKTKPKKDKSFEAVVDIQAQEAEEKTSKAKADELNAEAEKQRLEKLKQECNLAMKSLGVGSKERKYLISVVFEKHNPKSVQEFLQKAFIRNAYN